MTESTTPGAPQYTRTSAARRAEAGNGFEHFAAPGTHQAGEAKDLVILGGIEAFNSTGVDAEHGGRRHHAQQSATRRRMPAHGIDALQFASMKSACAGAASATRMRS